MMVLPIYEKQLPFRYHLNVVRVRHKSVEILGKKYSVASL